MLATESRSLYTGHPAHRGPLWCATRRERVEQARTPRNRARAVHLPATPMVAESSKQPGDGRSPLGDYVAGRFLPPDGAPLASVNPARGGATVLQTAWSA